MSLGKPSLSRQSLLVLKVLAADRKGMDGSEGKAGSRGPAEFPGKESRGEGRAEMGN